MYNPALAQSIEVEISDWGKIENQVTVEESHEMPTAVSGQVGHTNAYESYIYDNQTELQVKLNDRFGVNFYIKPFEGSKKGNIIDLEVKVIHPAIFDIQTNQTRLFSKWNMGAQVEIPRSTGWEFESDQELVDGTWEILIIHGDKILASKEFNITTVR